MAKRKYKTAEETIDPKTGEIKVTKYFNVIDKDTGTDYVKVYRAFTRRVMSDLHGKESVKARMLWWFVDQLQDRPYGDLQIYASTDKLVNQLKCSEVAVKKARAFLVAQGYIQKYVEPGSKRTSKNLYQINPQYVHKGREIK